MSNLVFTGTPSYNTSTPKFGSGALITDPSNRVTGGPALPGGTGPYTVEFFVKATSASSGAAWFGWSTATAWNCQTNGTVVAVYSPSLGTNISWGAWTFGTRQHFALCYDNTTGT